MSERATRSLKTQLFHAEALILCALDQARIIQAGEQAVRRKSGFERSPQRNLSMNFHREASSLGLRPSDDV